MMKRTVATAALLVGAIVTGAGLAHAADNKGPVTLPPHVHGEGHLDLAVDGGKVEIELTLPGADAIGFEHDADTAADKATLEAALVKIRNGAALFTFPAKARCRLTSAEAKRVEEGHDHKEHGHTEKEGEEPHHHSEVRAHYVFTCSAPQGLTGVDLGLFKAYPTLHEIEASTITAKGQGAATLKPGTARLKL